MLILSLVIILFALVAAFWFFRPLRRGQVRITLTDGRSIRAPVGSNLFQVLRDAGVDLPSTCGGQGSCAQCRCRILRGAERITEQERPYFSPEDLRSGVRLACRVTVQRDLLIEVPDPTDRSDKGRS